MVAFSDHFWGEKHTGFDVLQQNMKHGTTSTKEFYDFLKESCTVEDQYSRLLNRLSGLTAKYSQNGSFCPYWQLLKDFTVKLSSLRTQLVLGLAEIMKGLKKYEDEQHKRQKQVKEQEAGTVEVVQGIQQITVNLAKAKENYHTLAIEHERLRRENAAIKHMEKAAFMETVHAYLKGTDPESCKMKLIGDVMFAFPSAIVKILSDNPNPSTLTFRINNLQRIENLRHNSQLINKEELSSSPGVSVYSFDMVALNALLRRQYEENRQAKFFNIDVLKYEVKHGPGISSAPLHLVAYWKCEPTSTALRIDYKCNSSALNNSLPLQNVTLMVPITGDGATMTQSLPNGRWSVEEQRLYWSLGDMKPNTHGELRARFDLTGGPAGATPVAVGFACEGCTMSGVELELLGGGFRLTMVKKKVTSGRYTYDTDRPLSGTE